MKDDRLNLNAQFQAHAEALSDCIRSWHFGIGSGKSSITMCQLWDGIYLWANQIRDYDLPNSADPALPVAALNLCLRGRCEVMLPDGRYIYMAPGTACLCGAVPSHGYHYPGGNYEGIELFFYLDRMGGNQPAALEDYGLGLRWIEGTLTSDAGIWLANMSEDCFQLAENLFQQLKQGKGTLQKNRFQTLELLHRMAYGGAEAGKNRAYVTQGQRRIANEIEQRLTGNLGRRYTVAELAREYCVSESALKKYFTMVYGVPLTDYLRDRRVERACELLSTTRLSIGEIAAQCGYMNPSKFGKVFWQKMNMTPTEFRRVYFRSEDSNLDV